MTEYSDREALGIGKCNPEIFDDKGYANGWNAAIDIIKRVPAADVRPVVKAKWVYTDMSRLFCSNCENPVAFSLKEDGWHHGDFCPNCGAMMEES